jgi:hypothetical protein
MALFEKKSPNSASLHRMPAVAARVEIDYARGMLLDSNFRAIGTKKRTGAMREKAAAKNKIRSATD